jgi:membrane-associated phospholipid phosphatase
MASLKNKLLVPISIVSLTVITLFYFDIQIGIFVQDLIPHDFDYILKVLSKRGIYLFYFVFVGLIIYSFCKKNGKLKKVCWAYLRAQIIFSFAVVRGMKIFFGRARPGHGAEFTFFSFDSRYNSFPSGHSADAFVSGVFLFYLLKNSKYSKYRFLPLVYASLMALLRIVVSAHYTSDVVAGMAIGTLGACFFLSKLSDQPE